MTKTHNLTPSWGAVASIIAAALENGTDKGRRLARAELANMAAIIDAAADALAVSESFLLGFEDDPEQTGAREALALIRAVPGWKADKPAPDIAALRAVGYHVEPGEGGQFFAYALGGAEIGPSPGFASEAAAWAECDRDNAEAATAEADSQAREA